MSLPAGSPSGIGQNNPRSPSRATASVAMIAMHGAGYLAVFGTDQLQALVLLFLKGHSLGYSIGLVFFGLSLFVLGYLVFKSGYFPRILGVLLIVASSGYLIDSFAGFLWPAYDDYAAIFALVVFLPAFIGELAMCLWLLVKGVKVQQWDNRAPAPA